MKDNARILEFALRRKGVGIDANGETHISDYALSRKIAKKNIVVCLRSLQQIEREVESCLVVGEDHHLSIVIGFLREIAIATISMFRAILICLAGKTKPDNGFSLIQKLLPMGRPSCEKGQEITKEANIIDGTLRSLLKNVKKNEGNVAVIVVLNMEIIIPECEIIGNPREFVPSNPVSNGVSQQTTMPSFNRSSWELKFLTGDNDPTRKGFE
ncbi:nucleic acid-binding, OB-fold protein [Tanacetum coccineum]